jgi:hypothetical protein
MQASALLSEFMAAGKMGSADIIATIRERHRQELELLVRRLILISVAPPTSRGYDAQILLGMLASYAFDPMTGRLDSQLRHSPMAFRVWRAITKLVRLSGTSEHRDALREWVRQLIADSGQLRESSMYAGRSLDLELAISVPGRVVAAGRRLGGRDATGAGLEQQRHDPGTRHGGDGTLAARDDRRSGRPGQGQGESASADRGVP